MGLIIAVEVTKKTLSNYKASLIASSLGYQLLNIGGGDLGLSASISSVDGSRLG